MYEFQKKKVQAMYNCHLLIKITPKKSVPSVSVQNIRAFGFCIMCDGPFESSTKAASACVLIDQSFGIEDGVAKKEIG